MHRNFQSGVDDYRHVFRPLRYLRNPGLVEDVQQEFDRHGGRNDFFKLRQYSVSDGGDM